MLYEVITYDVTNKTLGEYVNIWIEGAEKRYDALRAGSNTINGLEAWEQLTLASIAQWECIGSDFKQQTVSVFLNRLSDDAKLQSCATVEYAIGYQRPYLTLNDIEIDSAVITSYSIHYTKLYESTHFSKVRLVRA